MRLGPSRGFALPRSADEPEFDALVEGARDSTKHGQRMSLIIRIFESRYDGGCGADKFRKLLLGQSRSLAKLIDLPGDRIVRFGFGQLRDSLRMSFVVAPMNDFNGIRGRFARNFFHRE